MRSSKPGIELKIAAKSIRSSGRPEGRLDQQIGFQDDCAFLIINPTDLAEFEILMPCLDAHYFTRQSLPDTNAADPVCNSRRQSIEERIRTVGLIVYKQGAISGLTMGLLVKAIDTPPKGWYVVDDDTDVPEELSYIVFEKDSDSESESNDKKSKSSDNRSESSDNKTKGSDNKSKSSDHKSESSDIEDDQEPKDDSEWMGVVRWYQVPFTQPGESGSLVFAKEENVTMPLGIHVGSPASMPNHSVFISLETYCSEAEREGWELRFPKR